MRSISFTKSSVIFFANIALSTQSDPIRQWTSTDCLSPVLPSGYNFADAQSQMLTPEFLTQLTDTCAKNGNNYKSSDQCIAVLAQAEDMLVNLFQTSDIDLVTIYNQMFGCSQFKGIPLITSITNSYNTLLQLNGTVYGTSQDPGLLNDLYTLMDGIDQIKAVANGQVLSVKNAASSQIVAAQNLQGQMTNTANAILSQTIDLMNSLVGNRTNAQNQVFSTISQAVQQATTDIQNQADAVSSQVTSQYKLLSDRYSQWSAQSQQAVSDVTTHSKDLQTFQTQADQAAQQMVRTLKTSELASVATQIANAKASFNNDLTNTQTGISTDIANLGNDLASTISANGAQFASQAKALSQSIANTETYLRGKISAASSVNALSANDAKSRGDAAAGKLRALLSTSINPLISDVQKSMQDIVTLSAAIETARANTNSDLTNLKTPALQAATALGDMIQSRFAGKQSDFAAKFKTIQSSLQQQVSSKVNTGRSQLAQIMGQVQTSQGSAASQQSLEGQTAQDQASASQTAAELVAAKQKAAADSTQSSIGTIVNVVGSALSDSQDTISAISKQNNDNIMSANQRIGSSQDATYKKAYSQVQASSDSASAQSASVQADSFSAQLTGQDLEQSISESGTELESSVAYQNRKAQSLLGDIQDILNLAKQNSGTLEEQMAAFEQQAPALYSILQQKIAAYKALLVSQGQQAQTSAATSAAGSAQGALGQLANSLQAFSVSGLGVSPSLSADQNKVGNDASSLIQDITALNSQLSKQSSNGAILVSNTAQAAATQAAAQIQSVSKDSAAALGALVNYNADLIRQKRQEILSSGDSALQSAMDASTFLQTNAQHFVDLSNQFLSDATHLGGQASQNLSSMVSDINQTLADLTASSDLYLSRLSDAAGFISAWPSQIVTQASKVNAQIQAKAAQVTSAIVAVADTSSAGASDIQTNIRNLQSFVDELIATFNKQRSTFNDFAQQYAVRRIQLLTGLNQTIATQRTDFLSGMTDTDLTEAQRTGSISDNLQGLLTSLENAKAQGTTDLSQVSAIMSKISDSVSGLTNSFANKMGVDLSALKQKAAKDAILSQQGIKGTVGQAGVSANLLAGQLADAIDKIAGNQFAAEMAANGASKDVYAIAGLLKNSGAETQNNIAALLRALQSGGLTFDGALAAAKTMTQKDVNTVLDILSVFNQYVSDHLGAVYQFNSTVVDSVNALNTTATKVISDHVSINAAALASMTTNQYKLAALSTALLPNVTSNTDGILQTLQTARNQSIEDVENYMNVVLHGNPPSQGALIQVTHRDAPISPVASATTQSTAATSAAVAVTVPSIPDAITQVNVDLASASTQVASSKNILDDSVTRSISAANAAVADILKITQSALQPAAAF